MNASAITLALILAATAANADTDATTGLIIAPGWQDVRAHCGGCHSHALVTQQRGSRQAWLEMIRWMQETQNLWLFQPDVEDRILSYLAENYAPQANRRRAPIPASLMPRATQPD